MGNVIEIVVAVIYAVLVLAALILFFNGGIEFFLSISAISLIIYVLEDQGKIEKGLHSILVRYFLACAIFVLVPAVLLVLFINR